jgi:hypothetical protein
MEALKSMRGANNPSEVCTSSVWGPKASSIWTLIEVELFDTTVLFYKAGMKSKPS